MENFGLNFDRVRAGSFASLLSIRMGSFSGKTSTEEGGGGEEAKGLNVRSGMVLVNDGITISLYRVCRGA